LFHRGDLSNPIAGEYWLNSTNGRYQDWFRRSLLFIALYTFVGWLVLRPPLVSDPDIWWHLRIGKWIVEHHAVPFNNWFSDFGLGRPWFAYSWLFEILVYGLYQSLGYVGLILYVYATAIGMTVFVHRLVARVEPRPAYSVGLTAVAMFAMAPLLQPRPWLLSILFFLIEFDLLLSVRQSRNYRRLFWLLPLFAFWANIHVQFVYGFFLLGLATVEGPLIQYLRKTRSNLNSQDFLPPKFMVLITIGCIAATLVNPYHIKLYAVLMDIFRQAGLYDLLSELKAMEFRTLPDFFALILTLAAAYALGRYRSLNVFWGILFAVSTILTFRSRRDVWFVTSVAVVLIPLLSTTATNVPRYLLSISQKIFISLAVILLLVLMMRTSHATESELQAQLAASFPVKAADFVIQQGYSGPLYNYYDWGGYLMWRFPNLLVSIDGRNQVHDMDRLRHYMGVWNGAPGWDSDHELSSSRVVIAEKVLPLAQLLRMDSRFQLVYEDQLSTVFIAKTR
jgi:hypothetical protein